MSWPTGRGLLFGHPFARHCSIGQKPDLAVALAEGPLYLFEFSVATPTAADAHDAVTCAGKGDGETKAAVPAVQTP